MKIVLPGTILTHTNISKALCDNNIYTIRDGQKILWQFFIFTELELFFYYYVINKTLNLSNVK